MARLLPFPLSAGVINGALLVVISAMAGGYTLSKHTVSLDQPVKPPGWHIRFRPPSDYTLFSSPEIGNDMIVFTRGNPRTQILMIDRDPDPAGDSPRKVARQCLRRQDRRGIEALFAPQPEPSEVAFGPLPGAMLDDVSQGVIVAAALVDGEAYCLTHIGPPPTTVRDIRVVEQVLTSIEIDESLISARP